MIKDILEIGQTASLRPSKATKVSWDIPLRYQKSVYASPVSHPGPSDYVEVASIPLKQPQKIYFQGSQGFPNINFWHPGLCSDVYVEDRECLCVTHTI